MAQHSKIEWTETTWNPVMGCTPASEGCRNCYARAMMDRFAGCKGWPETASTVTLFPERLEQPLHWKKPHTVFVCSMSDLFHEDVPALFMYRIFNTMAQSPQHLYQILTKHPRRMRDFVLSLEDLQFDTFETLFPNVWLGVSIEKPEYSYRANYLRQTPAAIRFISFEPLLASFTDCPGVFDDMDWVIVGGESGPGARPMHPDWARGIRDQCRAAGVAFFMKQMGGHPNKRTKLEDIPCDLRIREFPKNVHGDF